MLAGLSEVPVIIRPESEAMDVVINSMVHRQHFTKSALAYVMWPLFAPRAQKHGGDRKSAAKKSRSDDPILILSDIAVQLGVSEELVGFAKKAREIFEARPALRPLFEPKILSGELSLNRLPGAIAGKLEYEKTGGKRSDPTYLSYGDNGKIRGLMPSALTSLGLGIKAWQSYPPEARSAFRVQFHEWLASLPEELRP
jgi:hypothetical protein